MSFNALEPRCLPVVLGGILILLFAQSWARLGLPDAINTSYYIMLLLSGLSGGTFNNINLTLLTSQYKLIDYLLFTSHGTIAYIYGYAQLYEEG